MKYLLFGFGATLLAIFTLSCIFAAFLIPFAVGSFISERYGESMGVVAAIFTFMLLSSCGIGATTYLEENETKPRKKRKK